MLSVTKKFEFEAAHHLPLYSGKCKNLHGHTFKLEVTIAEGIKPEDIGTGIPQGMIIDFVDLKKIVNDIIIEPLDHKDLNTLFDMPTSETLVKWIANELKVIFGNNLIRIRLYETSNSYAEWTK